MNTNTRHSNFELLRIISMMFIIFHHFLIATETIDYSYHGKIKGGELINGFIIVGVNCFILISGYFGIHHPIRKILYILYSITFICGIDYILYLISPSIFNFSYAWQTICPFTKHANWFIPSYTGLLLLSPFLNKGIEKTSYQNLNMAILALTLFNLYAYIFDVNSINRYGYTMVQFIYLYIVGAWLKKRKTIPVYLAFSGYIVASIITGFYALYIHTGFHAYAYNSPWVLSASVCLFLMFEKLNIQNCLINRISKATFTVFLLHYIIIYYVKHIAANKPLHTNVITELILIYISTFIISVPIHYLSDSIFMYLNKIRFKPSYLNTIKKILSKN